MVDPAEKKCPDLISFVVNELLLVFDPAEKKCSDLIGFVGPCEVELVRTSALADVKFSDLIGIVVARESGLLLALAPRDENRSDCIGFVEKSEIVLILLSVLGGEKLSILTVFAGLRGTDVSLSALVETYFSNLTCLVGVRELGVDFLRVDI